MACTTASAAIMQRTGACSKQAAGSKALLAPVGR